MGRELGSEASVGSKLRNSDKACSILKLLGGTPTLMWNFIISKLASGVGTASCDAHISCQKVGLSPGYFTSSPTCVMNLGSKRWLKFLDHCHTQGRPAWSSGLLAPAWPGLNCYRHLGNGSMGGINLLVSFSFPPSNLALPTHVSPFK